jgi:hypothetical protein
MSLFAKVRKSLLVSMAVLSLAVFATAGTVSAAPAHAASGRPTCTPTPGTAVESDLGQVAITVSCKNLIPTAVYNVNAWQLQGATYGSVWILTDLGLTYHSYADLNGRDTFQVVTTFGTVPGRYTIYIQLAQPPFTSISFTERVLSPRD